MLLLQLFERLAVEGYESALHDGHQVQRPGDAGLVLKEISHSCDLVGGHIDKKDVGKFGRCGFAKVAEQRGLHQVDSENEHDAGSKRGQHCG